MKDNTLATPRPQPAEHALNIRKPYFDLIATGSKTIEIRVGYAKIRKMAAGDQLLFHCGDDTLTTRITALAEYASFEDMLDAEDNTAIGEPGMDRDQLLAACRNIYPPAKEALGVFAIHLTRLPM
ncbi:ASCH domain-containing protein [Streptomyces cacaoi]|uniref:ASCH domain-containing protein n=1 Tax=Streptomyces cacaoi TaxID=1898 RepID=UPI0037486FE5